jgi:hypothetical protein
MDAPEPSEAPLPILPLFGLVGLAVCVGGFFMLFAGPKATHVQPAATTAIPPPAVQTPPASAIQPAPAQPTQPVQPGPEPH